jgi:glycosyltransferase involved in cell wall biosynthesis
VKVLVVTTSYPRHHGDAAGCFVEARVDHLRAAGAEVQVLAAGVGGHPHVTRIPAAPALFYSGGAPEAFDRAPATTLAAGLQFWGRLIPTLAARLPWADRVESHWLLPSSMAVAALGYRGPHRAQAHSGDVALLERLPAGPALALWLLRRGPTLVFASADLRARFAALVGPAAAGAVLSAEVAPAESALLRAPPIRRSAGAAAAFAAARGIDAPVVLGVGRLVPIKGYDLLVRAVGRLPAAARPAVVVLGEGPERSRLQALARARGVTLSLPGEVDAAAVGDWLASAAVFVHPARRLPDGRSEGTPVALREAVAAGLSVVATATGGIAQLAPMGSGRFTLLQDREGSVGAEALAQAVARALLQGPPAGA